MKEIGSEFWLEREPKSSFHGEEDCYVLSGRTAIDLIIQNILSKKGSVYNAYLPAWCCDSMIEPFTTSGVKVELYDMSFDQTLHYHVDTRKKTDIFFVCNYFGYENTIDREIIRHFKQKGAIVVYDRTHSLLMENDLPDADYSFASIRKWMGVLSGAVVYGVKKNDLKPCPYLDSKEKAMRMKKAFIEGDDSIDKQSFLDLYSEFGHSLADDYQNYEMDDFSQTIYLSENFLEMRHKRRENATYLHSHLNTATLGKLSNKAVPLFVPIFFENKEQRNLVRKRLIDAQIYCPIHWPKNNLITPEMKVNQIFDKELSLICDQRYDIGDMKRMIEQIV